METMNRRTEEKAIMGNGKRNTPTANNLRFAIAGNSRVIHGHSRICLFFRFFFLFFFFCLSWELNLLDRPSRGNRRNGGLVR